MFPSFTEDSDCHKHSREAIIVRWSPDTRQQKTPLRRRGNSKIITGNVSHGRHLQTTNSGIKMVPKIRRIPCHDSVFIKQILVSKKDSLTPRIIIFRLNLSH